MLHTIYGAFKGRVDLPDGRYHVTAFAGLATTTAEVELKAGSYAEPVFIMNAGRLTAMAYGSEGDAIAEGAPIRLTMPGKLEEAYDYSVMDRIVPAGNGTVTAEVGTAKVSQDITITAGETLEIELVAAAGTAELRMTFAKGLPITEFYSFDVYRASDEPLRDEDLVGVLYGQGDPITLAVGDYLVRANVGMAFALQPFSVTAGQTLSVEVEVPAAPVRITVPGAEVIEIFAATADGSPGASLRYDYGEVAVSALFAGDYVAQATKGDTRVDIPFTVTLGQSAEVTATLP